MPIARVMNNPDGSTPVPQALAGGDVNGTLATSIIWHQAGSGAVAIDQARHLQHNTTTTGVPNAAQPLLMELQSG